MYFIYFLADLILSSEKFFKLLLPVIYTVFSLKHNILIIWNGFLKQPKHNINKHSRSRHIVWHQKVFQ